MGYDVYGWPFENKGPVEKEETPAPAPPNVRDYNIGNSNYSSFKIQPWSIWEEYKLNPWDADVVKRILRTKMIPGKTKAQARIIDYEKIIHVCQERIRQLKTNKRV